MENLSAKIESKLRPHQVEPAKRLLGLLSRGENCADLSDTGVGKTYVALAAVLSLNRPTLAIVPKVATTIWQGVAGYLGGEISVVNYELLRTGRTPFGWWDNTPPAGHRNESFFVCDNCQQRIDLEKITPCYTRRDGLHCLVEHKKPWRYGQFHFVRQVRQIIFDEAHRCGALDSLNADLMLSAKREGIPSLALTATPACSPLNLRALGFLLGLHSGSDFYTWAARYGCRRDPRFRGFKWLVGADRQREIMADIRGGIIPARGVRVTTGDIPGFPECNISAELYDLEEGGTIDRLYAAMAGALKELSTKTAGDTAAEHPLTKILRARQRIELLKVPLAVELAEDYRAKGCSVAIFCNFRQTIDELSNRLKCLTIVDGSPDGVKNRDRHIAAFQRNDSDRIILNSDAGGQCLSLHDVYGGHTRVGIVFPNFSANSLRQVLGRLPRYGGKSPAFYRVLFAAGTVEVPIHRALRSKLNNLDALTDADLQPENLRLARGNLADIFPPET
jgi:hypothetical protein